ncbi:MAG: quaternary ammonium transporter [Sphaerospermopsis sp. SIO1G2]|nr:quaternary ammonium transporter [Sphaerospermopsis sp. SIO1G2]
MKRLWFISWSVLCVLLVAIGCTPATKTTVRVGSKDFTEQFIVAEMYAILLESEGFEVERQLNLGSTPIVHDKIVAAEIDIYPEYTGTSYLTVLKQEVETDPQVVYGNVASEYAQQFDLTVLEPAPMNNTQAIAMTKAHAAELGIATISDLVEKSGEIVLVGPIEFLEREDGIAGLKTLYGDFEFAEYRPIDPGLRYVALANGEIDAVVAFGTDGQINEFDLLVLEDDRQFWPPYQIAPVIRTPLVTEYPEITEVLNQLALLLTNDTMRRLNNEVSSNGRSPAEVAQQFLSDAGLLND